MRDKNKRKPNKWERLRATNAELRSELRKKNAELELVAQAVAETKAILEKESADLRGSFRALGLGSALDPLEPPTDMSPLDPREPLAGVEPEGERSIG